MKGLFHLDSWILYRLASEMIPSPPGERCASQAREGRKDREGFELGAEKLRFECVSVGAEGLRIGAGASRFAVAMTKNRSTSSLRGDMW